MKMKMLSTRRKYGASLILFDYIYKIETMGEINNIPPPSLNFMQPNLKKFKEVVEEMGLEEDFFEHDEVDDDLYSYLKKTKSMSKTLRQIIASKVDKVEVPLWEREVRLFEHLFDNKFIMC